jgi:AraC-like DNA-binding protein
MLDSFSVQIAVMLLRAMKNDIKPYRRYADRVYVNQAIDLMHESFCDNISITQICEEVHISSYPFIKRV